MLFLRKAMQNYSYFASWSSRGISNMRMLHLLFLNAKISFLKHRIYICARSLYTYYTMTKTEILLPQNTQL